MADLSKIKLNGVEYDLKDNEARELIANKQDKVIYIQYTTLDNGETFTCNKTYSEILALANSSNNLIIGQIIFVDGNNISEATQIDSARIHANVIEWPYLIVGDNDYSANIIEITHDDNNVITTHTVNTLTLERVISLPKQFGDNKQLCLVEEPILYYGSVIMPFNFIKCSSLPENNITPITTDNESFTVYYISSNNIQGYVPTEIASQYNLETGWYTLQQVLALFAQINNSNAEYMGVVSDYNELLGENTGNPYDNYGLVISHNFYIHEAGNKYLYLGGPAIQPGEGKNSIIINGDRDTATGIHSLVNGAKNDATGVCSHAEGYMTTASGVSSHSEGNESGAYGWASHAEGWSWAHGEAAHSEGEITWALGEASHSEGVYTEAHGQAQHVSGRFNIIENVSDEKDFGQYAEIVGNGTDNENRSNARTLDWNGNEVLAGKLTIGTAPTANMDVTTKQYVDNKITSDIATAIGGINQFEVAIVADLPTTDIDAHTIYFKSNSSSGNNIYDEYMYINSSWEIIGSTAIDLSNYLQTSDIADWAKQANKPTYTASEVGALPDTTAIPTVPSNISAFTNDVGYISSYNETDPVFTASAAAEISSTDISNWNAKSDFSGSYNDLTDQPTIPDVPTWALESTKPTYTANEVGALPSTYTAPVTSVNGQTGEVNLTIPAAQVQSDWNATSGMGVILNKPTIPVATTVTNTLASGTLIATINGTNIYAPAYTDADGVSY